MEKTEEGKCVVALRIRGVVSARREARQTLEMLRLSRSNYAILVENTPSILGMLKSVQSYVTWGEISRDTLKMLISERGRLAGNKKLTPEYLQKAGYESVDALSDAVFSCRAKYSKLPGIQPVFKLHPPTKGFKRSIKKSFRGGGELGYRGEGINELVRRMF